MKAHRVWIEIVMLGTAIACACALFIAMVATAAGTAESNVGSPQPNSAKAEQAYEGMVTCSRCRARHSAALGQTADVCVRVCVHAGAKFALVGADFSYLLDGDLNALKKLAGQRARIVGTLNGNTIKVTYAAPET